jgi:translation initiation factor 2 alpha subunit (eIF-2alpha)
MRADGVSFAPLQLEQLYSSVAWPLYKLYGHAFDAFKVMVQDPDAVFSKLLEVGGQDSLLCPV